MMADGEVRPLLTTLTFEARTYDVDYAGIVSNIVYVRWLEDLRGAMLSAHFTPQMIRATGVGPVLLHTDIHYRRALRLGDRPQGQMWVAEVRRARWVVQATFILGSEIVCQARQTGAFVDILHLQPVRLPEALRQALQAAGMG